MVPCLPSCTIAVPDIPSVPDQPTYDRDIRPYLEDHCLVCHSSPPDNGAPDGFRFDVYADIVIGDRKIQGAQTTAGEIERAAVYSDPRQMPPGDGLGPHGKQMLVDWVKNGAPER